MFTGIITHLGTIQKIEKSGDWRMVIAADFSHDLAIGASVSCSGACMTVIEKTSSHFTVQVSGESLSRTTLGSWKEGTKINLERALKLGDELGGHMVSGHVDGVASLKERTSDKDSFKLTFTAPQELSKFIVEKGSVVLDGVSLTVNEVAGAAFSVNIIPHTLTATTLGALKTGDRVNLEIDLIARYLARFMEK